MPHDIVHFLSLKNSSSSSPPSELPSTNLFHVTSCDPHFLPSFFTLMHRYHVHSFSCLFILSHSSTVFYAGIRLLAKNNLTIRSRTSPHLSTPHPGCPNSQQKSSSLPNLFYCCKRTLGSNNTTTTSAPYQRVLYFSPTTRHSPDSSCASSDLHSSCTLCHLHLVTRVICMISRILNSEYLFTAEISF